MKAATDLENRRASVIDAPAPGLTVRQAEIVSVILRYQEATGDVCRVSYLERKLKLSRSGVRAHIAALCQKGWIDSERSPFTLRRPAEAGRIIR